MAFVQKFPEDFFCEFVHVKKVFAQTSYLYVSFVLVTNIWFLCNLFQQNFYICFLVLNRPCIKLMTCICNIIGLDGLEISNEFNLAYLIVR